MLTRQHFSLRLTAALFAILTLVVASAQLAFAQEEKRSSAFADIVKGVILDPTTYAPAAIAYDATMRDWNSSQPFFRHGYFERNERFTISGLPNDRPLSYSDGRQRILSDAFVNLQMSLANNVADQV